LKKKKYSCAMRWFRKQIGLSLNLIDKNKIYEEKKFSFMTQKKVKKTMTMGKDLVLSSR